MNRILHISNSRFFSIESSFSGKNFRLILNILGKALFLNLSVFIDHILTISSSKSHCCIISTSVLIIIWRIVVRRGWSEWILDLSIILVIISLVSIDRWLGKVCGRNWNYSGILICTRLTELLVQTRVSTRFNILSSNALSSSNFSYTIEDIRNYTSIILICILF